MKKGILFSALVMLGCTIGVGLGGNAKANDVYALENAKEPVKVTTVEDGGVYKLGMDRTSATNKTGVYYFNGTTVATFYLGSTLNYEEGLDITFHTVKENADGTIDCNLTYEMNGSVEYLYVTGGKHFNIKHSTTVPTEPLVYKDGLFTAQVEGKDGSLANVMIGNHDDYDSFACVLNLPENYGAYLYTMPELTADEKAANAYGDKLITLTAADCEAKDVKAETWTAAENAYNELSAGAKAIFTAASANENGTATEKGAARYDAVLAAHPDLNNFANRTTKTAANAITTSNDNTIIIVSVSVLSVAILGAAVLLLKRRKNA